MSLGEFGALLMYAGTVVVVGAALVGAIVALLAGRRRWAGVIALGAVAWLAVYGALLVATSLTSHEEALPEGSAKRFCGVYLDCHLGVEVTDARRVDALGPLEAPAHPDNGAFAVVTVRVSSDAERATLPLRNPVVALRDADGAVWQRDPEGERALALEGGAVRPLEGEVTAGSSYTVDVVFDVPAELADPRLDVTSGEWLERASELFLIGDEDSWLHAPRTLRVPWTQSGATARLPRKNG